MSDILQTLRKGSCGMICEAQHAADEIEFLRSELIRAVRDINRIGNHTASPDHCDICDLVMSYGFDPEALRGDKVGAGGVAE